MLGSDFVFSLILITSDELKTLPYGLASIDDAYDANWGELMAGALLGSVPIAMIYVFFLDYYVSGLTAGATKG